MNNIVEHLNIIYKKEKLILFYPSIIFSIAETFEILVAPSLQSVSLVNFLLGIVSEVFINVFFIAFVPLFIYAIIKFNKISNFKKEANNIITLNQSDSNSILEFEKVYKRLVFINLLFVLTPVFFYLI